MLNFKTQPHIQLSKSDATFACLVVGDPKRAEDFANMCDSHKQLAYNREYRSFHCNHEGQSFLIVSHGVGSAGAAICFQELCAIGVKCIIRAGTCGTLQPKLHQQGDLVVVFAAAKEDGVSLQMEPRGMPSVATPAVTDLLMAAAKSQNVHLKLGLTLTSDVFYPSKVNFPSLNTLKTWQSCMVDVVEMEVATLFVIARLNNVECGAIVAVDGCPFGWEDGDYDPYSQKLAQAKSNMAKVALRAIVNRSQANQQ